MSLLAMILSNAIVASLLGAMAFAAHRLARRPFLAHALLVLALIKLLTPPLLPLRLGDAPWGIAEPARVVAEPNRAGRASEASGSELALPSSTELTPGWTARAGVAPDRAPPIPTPPLGLTEAARGARQSPAPSWSLRLSVIWIAGTTMLVALAALRVARFRRALRSARPAPDEVQAQVAGLAAALGLRRLPGVLVVPARISPMLWTLCRRPRVLLPEGLLARLDQAERSTLLAHELTHYARRDHWVRYLELIATTLYWWLPTLWLGRRLLHQMEEQCCDARVVVAFPNSRRTYARALLETLDFLAGVPRLLPVAACGMASGAFLRSRVMMILSDDPARRLTRTGRAAITLLAAVLLPLLPTFGNPQEAPKPRATEPGHTVVARVGDAEITAEQLWDHLLASQLDDVLRILEDARLAEMLITEREIQIEEKAVEAAMEELRADIAPGETLESLRNAGDPRHGLIRERARSRVAWAHLAGVQGEPAASALLRQFARKKEEERFNFRRAGPRQRMTDNGLVITTWESSDGRPLPAGTISVTTSKEAPPRQSVITLEEARRTAAVLATPAARREALRDLVTRVVMNRAGLAANVAVTEDEVAAWCAEQNARHQPPFTWAAICKMKGSSAEKEAQRWRNVELWKRISGSSPTRPSISLRAPPSR